MEGCSQPEATEVETADLAAEAGLLANADDDDELELATPFQVAESGEEASHQDPASAEGSGWARGLGPEPRLPGQL